MEAAPSRSLPLFLLLASWCFYSSAIAQPTESPANDRFARIVLFVPDDAEIPADYQERLTAIALRTEAFFADGIAQWGWPVARREIFARTDDDIEVTVVRGALPERKAPRVIDWFHRIVASSLAFLSSFWFEIIEFSGKLVIIESLLFRITRAPTFFHDC